MCRSIPRSPSRSAFWSAATACSIVCADGAEARRFNRLLIDAGLIKGPLTAACRARLPPPLVLEGSTHDITHRARMNLLSIQSHVAYGHVGNSAAVFPLQRHRRRGVAGPHRAVLEPHRLWRVARARLRAARHPRGGRGHRRSAACWANATACFRAICLADDRGGDPGNCRAGEGRQSLGALLLRSGDRRHGARRVRASRRAGIHPRPGAAGRRYRHAQPVRARLLLRPRKRTLARCACRRSLRCMASGRASSSSLR